MQPEPVAQLRPLSTRRRAARALVLTALAGSAAGAAACHEIGTDPKEAISIAFDSLPSPSIVVGDTLRDDSTGAVAPLSADAFNGNGQRIPGATFTYFPRDTGGALEVVNGNLLVARKPRDLAATIIASLGNLQVSTQLFVVPRPDSIVPGDSMKLKAILSPDTSINVTDAVPVRVTHVQRDTADQPSGGVGHWVVFFRVLRAAPDLADSVWLVGAANTQRKTADTTDASGVTATLRVRVFAKRLSNPNEKTNIADSVVLSATARYRGHNLPSRSGDSTVRVVVPIGGVKP